ncbi:MAG: sensor histidine kinase KdpD [Alphaproteobacteria bacterium]|nr:sensor histidine kinase KdpD [Alphaproteobacteria bacterium]
MMDARPSPEALLKQAERESRGKLKIFLGAAPGVGKTFEMLSQARRRRLDGVDVAIGVVETHGRIETDALTKGFDVIPKKRSLYKGRVVAEMDLDAILTRRPGLVLVDELAHTNAEGSRHPKRYQDVEELLAAGVDVYTTVNIQHIESLNDVIAQITRIHVRETVPDEILDRASEIELVDTTPDDLLERLRAGKIYVKATAERALKHFFAPGNLNALRELALRRTALRVDRDVGEYTQARAIGGPAGERILVCVNEHPSSPELVRRAKRIADNFKAPWIALYIEGPRHLALTEPEKDRVAGALRLAQRLGAETVTVPGRGIAQTVLDHARKTNVTQIVIGKSARSRWFELVNGSVVRELMRDSGAISITAVMAQGDAARSTPAAISAGGDRIPWQSYAWSLLGIAVTIGVAWAANAVLDLAAGSIAMFFLVPVLLSAVSFGLRPALLTAFASVMAYNFFFLPPVYTFTIADPNNWLSFSVLLLVAVTAANLAARVRAQANLAAQRAAVAGELYQFTGKLAAIARLDDILWAAAFQIASMLKSNVVILLPDAKGRLEIRIGYPPEDELDAQDLAAAMWSWEKRAPAGRNAETLPGAKRLFLPMRTGEGVVGVIGLLAHDARPYAPDDKRLLDSLVDQTALAVERSLLSERVHEAQVRAEADKLRVAMLSSLSHDLRTPLASILGAATSLISGKTLYGVKETDELLATIRDEAERLDRFVGNLLDMSRLEAGVLGVKPETVSAREMVDAALKRLGRRLSTHRVAVEVPDDLPLVAVDPLLLEQALVNVLDNAGKYAPEGSTIRIVGMAHGPNVLLCIEDEGPGIAEEELPHIFDKFYRAKAADRRVAGTGLGLAVARGFVEAFGGRVEAANRSGAHGAVLTLTLPRAVERNDGL